MAWIGAVASLAGTAMSSKGAKDSAKVGRHARAEMEAQQLEAGARRNRIADKLEQLATKMINDEPISGAERAMINQATQVANSQINKASKEAMEQALGAQAATGFLKSGRTADQIRKLSLESAEAKQRIALQQQQALVGGIERNRQTAISAFSSAGGLGIPNFQQINQPLNPNTIMGAGLTQLGGAGLQLAGDMAKAEAVRNANSRDVSASDTNRTSSDRVVT